MKTKYIYKLVDPKTSEPRYVGCSVNPTARSADHKYTCKAGRGLVRWVRSLMAQGEYPRIVVVEQCLDDARASSLELFWIKEYARQGYSLLNEYGLTISWPDSS